MTVRARQLHACVARLRGQLTAPADVDATAADASLIASIRQLIFASRASGWFGGLPVETDANRARIESQFETPALGIFGSGP